ncbi:hypothetical protein BD560DRAFT_419327 [Blakeslea trispora]|nr:hypothetical protein BD560DRAFT_419327 [Blakeslea trispora]
MISQHDRRERSSMVSKRMNAVKSYKDAASIGFIVSVTLSLQVYPLSVLILSFSDALFLKQQCCKLYPNLGPVQQFKFLQSLMDFISFTVVHLPFTVTPNNSICVY